MTASGNVGIAFALVIGAGLCTSIGACAAFFAKLASTKFLAIGLGIAAGVMIYVSFVEIFMTKGLEALVDGGWNEDDAYRWGTIMFFGGMFATGLLDLLVHGVSHLAGNNKNKDATAVQEVKDVSGRNGLKPDISDVEAGKPPASVDSGSEASGDTPEIDQNAPVHLAHTADDIDQEAAKTIDAYVTADHHRFGLQKMGLLTALAIGIHNLPEGLATFIAALSDPLNGLAIAVAIALHNIPEGVCVAMPVYYATGSRTKGFLWAFLSGVSEPIGGLLGYAFLYGNRMSDVAYGILFCVVGGMMVFISLMELIPTALKYDEHNKYTSKSIVFGMIVMAASLLFFTI
eukprot:jgi/Ulvmu1/7812/UM004_0041.1